MAGELERRAAFAANFVDGTTNLAQRRRYQEDIAAAEEAERMEGEEIYNRAYNAAAIADPLKAEDLRLRERGQDFTRERAFAQMTASRNRFEKEMSLDEKKFQLDQNKFRIAEQKMKRELDLADRLQVQSNNVEQGLFEMNNNGIRRGSEAGANAVLSLLLNNPDIPKPLQAAILKDYRVDVDPEELEFMMGMAPEGSRLSVTLSPNGKSWTISPPLASRGKSGEDAVRSELMSEYKELLNMYKAAPTEEDQTFFKNEIAKVSAKLRGAGMSSNANSPKTRPSTAKALVAGDVVDGFEFRGGDPKDQANWLKK